jgi:hypothetical protein
MVRGVTVCRRKLFFVALGYLTVTFDRLGRVAGGALQSRAMVFARDGEPF